MYLYMYLSILCWNLFFDVHSGQRMLEEFESHLGDAKQKCSESEEKATHTSKLLAKVKNGVEHLSEKLQHIKAVSMGAYPLYSFHVDD